MPELRRCSSPTILVRLQLQYIGHLLGWEDRPSDHFANTNPHPFNVSEVDLAFVARHNENDARLYQAALTRFGQQVAQMQGTPIKTLQV